MMPGQTDWVWTLHVTLTAAALCGGVLAVAVLPAPWARAAAAAVIAGAGLRLWWLLTPEGRR